MASYIVSARLRRALGLGGPLTSSTIPAAPSPFHPPFTAVDWLHAQNTREAIDALTYPHRWRVTVTPVGDNKARQFWLRGTLESVTRRGLSIFTAPCLLVVEPAQSQQGGEIFDARLSLST